MQWPLRGEREGGEPGHTGWQLSRRRAGGGVAGTEAGWSLDVESGCSRSVDRTNKRSMEECTITYCIEVQCDCEHWALSSGLIICLSVRVHAPPAGLGGHMRSHPRRSAEPDGRCELRGGAGLRWGNRKGPTHVTSWLRPLLPRTSGCLSTLHRSGSQAAFVCACLLGWGTMPRVSGTEVCIFSRRHVVSLTYGETEAWGVLVSSSST